jgi:oligopeptide/dipeptide ABC transporter ATP-binding protein
MNRLLEINDLRVEFSTDAGMVRAVDGVSYGVDRGETLAIVGESGCGKSVSALSIMGLLPKPAARIQGGEILFNGTDLLGLDNGAMRHIRGKEIAMVFQEPMTSLNPLLTIGLQLTEALQLHMNMNLSQAQTRAQELLERVEISEAQRRLKQYPHHLSGGMRQRVMLALALACEPKVIIADEPTTALDVTIQAQILELMKDLTHEMGMALVIITHNLGIVARYADTVNIMYAGKVVEGGAAKDIYATPRHPYTQGLMKSVPRPDLPREAKLVPIEGHPPDLSQLPPGCSFHPRCPYAVDICRQEVPLLLETTPKHTAACWLVDEIGTAV